jgi:hypothetical protein
VARPAAEQDEDARPVSGPTGHPSAGLDAGGNGAGQADREGADTPGLKKLAPTEPPRGSLSGIAWSCHRIDSPQSRRPGRGTS